MKESRYLVIFAKNGFYSHKQIKDTEDWTFTNTISDAKRYKTIHGAFIRIDAAKGITKFDGVSKSILVEEVETIGDKEVTTIVARLEYKVMDRFVEERKIEITEPVVKQKTKKVVKETTDTVDKPLILKKRETVSSSDDTTEPTTEDLYKAESENEEILPQIETEPEISETVVEEPVVEETDEDSDFWG